MPNPGPGPSGNDSVFHLPNSSFLTKIVALLGAVSCMSVFSLFLTHGRLEKIHLDLHLSRLDAGGLAKIGRKIEEGILSSAVVHGVQNFVTDGAAPGGGGSWNVRGHPVRKANTNNRPVARGVSGLPLEKTPAVLGARRGHIECEIDVDSLAYWNSPRGVRDAEFVSPYLIPEGETRYITFEPDSGGWNNIRMSMEIIFVLAAATGRTLVLPPAQPLYLLHHDSKNRGRGFADFYHLDDPDFKKIVKTISTEDFLRLEGGKDGRLPVSKENAPFLENMEFCEKRKNSSHSCFKLYSHLREVGVVPEWKASEICVIFDQGEMTDEKKKRISKFCEKKRKPVYYDETLQNAVSVHFSASIKEYRLLNHFYSYILFTDPVQDNFYKRFVRDFLHYKDSIFCAAGKIINALQEEGKKLGFSVDKEGGGGFSSLHVRRGDLQYKAVKISGEEWLENTKDFWLEKELLYIATDEKKKEFFDPIKEKFQVKFLDDYWDLAGLSNIDPNYMGMIDTIVASQGRIFAGTYFSTFTGFINRMRGYYGFPGTASWYGMKGYKAVLQKWVYPHSAYYPREFPIGWVGIDGDTLVTDYPEHADSKVKTDDW